MNNVPIKRLGKALDYEEEDLLLAPSVANLGSGWESYLKLLPKTSSRDCGEPKCMVFAARIAEGAKGPEDCQALKEE
jgi:CO dehydrogenase/acetyl-CoA synthase gamma subunit (corrinoid Fe-S protein)